MYHFFALLNYHDDRYCCLHIYSLKLLSLYTMNSPEMFNTLYSLQWSPICGHLPDKPRVIRD